MKTLLQRWVPLAALGLGGCALLLWFRMPLAIVLSFPLAAFLAGGAGMFLGSRFADRGRYVVALVTFALLAALFAAMATGGPDRVLSYIPAFTGIAFGLIHGWGVGIGAPTLGLLAIFAGVGLFLAARVEGWPMRLVCGLAGTTFAVLFVRLRRLLALRPHGPAVETKADAR